MKKRIFAMFILAASMAMVACSSSSTKNEGATNGDNQALQILEKKREFYKAQDREKAKLEAEAKKAQTVLFSSKLELRERIIASIRDTLKNHVTELAELAVKETGMGRVADKELKNKNKISKIPIIELFTKSKTTLIPII
mgnify:CR=1 FL=1